MKTKTFFLTLVALLAFAGNACAQRDITSQYITNAKLSNGTNGWTVSNFNTPQQGNNTEGYACEAYAGWDNLSISSYSLKQTIKLPKGNYRLCNYSFFRQGLRYNTDSSKSLAYLKAGNQQEKIKTLGSISGIPTNGENGGYANSQADGANCFDSKMYRNVIEFSIATDNTPIEIGIEGSFDAKQSWVIAGLFELFDLDDEASVSSPTDMTYAITNSGFEYRNATGWTVDNMSYQDNNWANKSGIGFMEAWQWNAGLSNRQVSQQLTGLPDGLYEVSVYGHNINQQNGDAPSTGMFLYANNDKTEMGAYGHYKVRTTVTDGNLLIKVALENCTGNWIAFDRFSLLFYGDPLQALKDLRDGYVTEAQDILNGNDAQYLTAEQQAALQSAINTGNAATTEEDLNTVTTTTLPNAISTAQQQISTAKASRGRMLSALERFEKDYNLVDGTDYGRVTMSAQAWTYLLEKVMDVTEAMDDISLLSEFDTRAQALEEQMDATDASIHLFKGYLALLNGINSFGDTNLSAAYTTYKTDTEYTDDDTKVQDAINALDDAFEAYAATQYSNFEAGANRFLGENLDFESANGTQIDNAWPNVYNQVGWTTTFSSDATSENRQYAYLTRDNASPRDGGTNYVRLRQNWAVSPIAPHLQIQKETMIPTGKYELKFYIKSETSGDYMNTDLNYYQLGDASPVSVKPTSKTWTERTYDIEVSEPTFLNLSFGFITSSGNSPASVWVDDITLTYLAESEFQLALDAARSVSPAHDATNSAISEYESYENNEDAFASAEARREAINVLKNAKTIADNSDEATSLVANADFTGGTQAYDVLGSGGRVQAPSSWTFDYNYDGWNDTFVNDGLFNVWAGAINHAELYQSLTDMPNGVYRLTADIMTDVTDGTSTIGLYGFGTSDVARSQEVIAADFDTYSCAFEVKNHTMTIGIRSDKAYYKLKNIKVEYIGTFADNEAETDASFLRQDYFWDGKDVLEFDASGDKYQYAQNVVIYPNQHNQLITAKNTAQFANTNNKIVDGVCANLVLTDGAGQASGYGFHNSTAFTATNVTYDRSFAADTRLTVCLPYVPIGYNGKFYELSNVTEESLIFSSVETPQANTPYVFVAGEGGSSLNASNVTVPITPNEMKGGEIEGHYMVGVFNNTPVQNIYGFTKSGNLAFATSSSMNPFRAFVQSPSSLAKYISSIFTNGEADGIFQMVFDDTQVDVYTLSGTLVRKNVKRSEALNGLSRGVYIVGGIKKVK